MGCGQSALQICITCHISQLCRTIMQFCSLLSRIYRGWYSCIVPLIVNIQTISIIHFNNIIDAPACPKLLTNTEVFCIKAKLQATRFCFDLLMDGHITKSFNLKQIVKRSIFTLFYVYRPRKGISYTQCILATCACMVTWLEATCFADFNIHCTSVRLFYIIKYHVILNFVLLHTAVT